MTHAALGLFHSIPRANQPKNNNILKIHLKYYPIRPGSELPFPAMVHLCQSGVRK